MEMESVWIAELLMKSSRSEIKCKMIGEDNIGA